MSRRSSPFGRRDELGQLKVIWVGNLTAAIASSQLIAQFSSHGQISSLVRPVPIYAFIQFSNEASAQRALREHGTYVDGRQLQVALSAVNLRRTTPIATGKNRPATCAILLTLPVQPEIDVYAHHLKQTLTNCNIDSKILRPALDSDTLSQGEMLAVLKSRGSRYAIVLIPEDAMSNRITLVNFDTDSAQIVAALSGVLQIYAAESMQLLDEDCPLWELKARWQSGDNTLSVADYDRLYSQLITDREAQRSAELGKLRFLRRKRK